MEEIALHILDIIENSISAKASLVKVIIEIDEKRDLLNILIEDNGKGMEKEEVKKAMNPFYTSKDKKVGLGIPLFAQVAEACGGYLRIESERGKGTKVSVTMKLNHIDRPPLGDLASTFFTTILGHPNVDFLIEVKRDEREVRIDTREIKEIFGEKGFSHPEVIKAVREMIEEEMKEVLKGGI